jgi:general secretion pathway protein H
MTSRANSTSGFTLIEMIVVLVVLGLMLGIVVARGPMRSQGLSTRGAAGELAGALREARGKAIASNRPVSLELDLAAKTYRIGTAPPRALPRELAVSLLTTAGQARSATDAGIRFDPDGSSTGGRIVLADGQRKLQIGVDWLTGRVSVANAP